MSDQEKIIWLIAWMRAVESWHYAENEGVTGSNSVDDANEYAKFTVVVLDSYLGREPTAEELASVLPDSVVAQLDLGK